MTLSLLLLLLQSRRNGNAISAIETVVYSLLCVIITHTQISVIAKQSGQELRPYETDSGNDIAFIHEGKRSHLEILTKEHSALTSYCWVFRSLTWLFTVFGTSMASKTFAMMSKT